MAGPKKSTPAEDLIASLLKDVGDSDLELSSDSDSELNLDLGDDSIEGPVTVGVAKENTSNSSTALISDSTSFENEEEVLEDVQEIPNLDLSFLGPVSESSENISSQIDLDQQLTINEPVPELSEPAPPQIEEAPVVNSEVAPAFVTPIQPKEADSNYFGESEKTVAVTGYQIKASDLDIDDKVKVSVGQNRGAAFSSGYAAWGSNVESNLGQAENLRIAQDKIIELERENEKLRQQNEELMSASEIIKERSDLLTAQVTEFKNDRDGLEESFKNEMTLLKSHLSKRDSEMQKAQFKIDELESRLKFDMKKIRIRERELENRLELVRAEKNAILKNKDEQILDLRRKMDIIQMEVESYRQKCVELNKLIETNQDSFKRTTRALRLAMASLELQEENKAPLKKVD